MFEGLDLREKRLVHDYDVTLKMLLRGAAEQTFLQLAGVKVAKWLDVEFPKLQNPRADLLGETTDGTLLHVELQSTNNAEMALRMAEYCLGVYRMFDRFPKQFVLYVGEAPMRMPARLDGEGFSFHYGQVDARDMDGAGLIESAQIGDNVISILTRVRDHVAAIRQIIDRIKELDVSRREIAVEQLLVLASLRKLGRTVREELEKMPITADIMDHEVIGPVFRQGRQEGEQGILRSQISKRFGAVPAWAEAKLTVMTSPELQALALRLMDSPSLEDLFPSGR